MAKLELIVVTQIEAAQLLRVTDRQVRNLEKRGLLTGKRLGKIKLYPIEAVKKLAGVQ